MDQKPTIEDQEAVDTKRAKEDLDTAVAELSRACQGTNIQFELPMRLVTIQLDILADTLCNQKLIDRRAFYERTRNDIEKLTSDVRRALLVSSTPQIVTGPKKN